MVSEDAEALVVCFDVQGRSTTVGVEYTDDLNTKNRLTIAGLG